MKINLKSWLKKSAKQKVYYGKCCRCKGGGIGTRGNSCYANDSNCCGKNKKSNKSRQNSNTTKNSKSKTVDRSKRSKNKKNK